MSGRITYSRLDQIGLPTGNEVPAESRVFKNAYWYDQSLRPIGCGDLGDHDINKLTQRLEPGELFIAVPSSQRNPYNANDRIDVAFAAYNFGLLTVPLCAYLPGRDGGTAHKRESREYPTLSGESAKLIIRSIMQQ